MTRTLSPKLVAYVGLAAVGLVAALALRLQELVVVAAPFALLPAVSLLLARSPRIETDVELESERALEGEELEARVALTAETGAARLEVLLELPRGIGVTDGDDPASISIGHDDRRDLRLRLCCERWGGYRVGRVFLRARDRFGFVAWEWEVDRRSPLKVYPREEFIRDLLRPLETQVFSGHHVSRQRGEGIEFADLRLFVPGDHVRHVNWRATARRGDLWVNEQHAERNADVLLFMDTFTEASREGRSTLDLALRAAASLIARYLQQKDRVGFVTFGGMLNWMLPATGTIQLYRLVDSLIDTQIVLNYAWRDIDVLPRRTLPPKAMVIALTPLLDDRAAGALLDLRARGFDLVVVEISPQPFMPPPSGEVSSVARRVWELRREALRSRFQEAGVPIAVWNDERALAEGLEEVTTFRRRGRVVVA
ncbi:MAG: DUF58 domain-containing protein [Gaiellaceae bacterium]